MKKIIKICSLFIILICISGCLKEDKLTNENVYTTIYPIKYLTEYLYGETKVINSIYPNGAEVTKYELTNKQKETYSKGALFVYNGLTNEKELAREFLNTNKNMLLIDVSYGLKYENNLEELWLSPNNCLMLAKNIKNNLLEYTTSKVTKESIEKKYSELEEKLSYMDAELRSIAASAIMDGSATILTSSDKLKFLEKYGFEIINVNSDNVNATTIKNNFTSGNYKDIYLCTTDTKSELITELESKYKANIITVNTMETLTDTDAANHENYLTIMDDFIDNIRNTTLS